MSARQRVEIQIDELVLIGFSPADRQAIADGLTLELQNLITTGQAGDLAGLKDAPNLRAGSITLNQGEKPARVGALVAGAVHRSLAPQAQRGMK